jgi:hypothetical protein
LKDLDDQQSASEDYYQFARNEIGANLGLSKAALAELSGAQLLQLAKEAEARGDITKIQLSNFETALNNNEAATARLATLEQMLLMEKGITDQIKARYKAQIDLLSAQMQAIKDAKTMRDLQKEASDIAARSITATRVGAVGTLEAQFNQRSLNAEIENMNRTLQDRLMTAQLEAQQKILEDTQQQALITATDNLTREMINLADVMREEEIPAIEDLARSNRRTGPTGIVSATDRFDDTIKFAGG